MGSTRRITVGVARARRLVRGGLPSVAALLALTACGPDDADPGTPSRSAEEPPLAFEVSGGATPRFERVVLVTIDTLRADHLATYGYFRVTSPFLDQLAKRSVVFERAFAASSHTAPSHATMFTGLPPVVHGLLQNGDGLPPGVPTVAEAYADAGFETAAFTSVRFLEGTARGFGHVRARTSWAVDIANEAITWLREARSSDRFFLWLHFYDPHRWKFDDKTPQAHLEVVRRRTPGDEASTYEEIARLHGLPAQSEGSFEPVEWVSGDRGKETMSFSSRSELLERIDAYDAQISYADAELFRFYRALREAAFDGPTLFVVTSDHGEGLGGHGYAGHGWQLYDEQLAVPLIVHATDGSLAPRRLAEQVSLLDLTPTLLDYLGADVRGGVLGSVGRSLVPLLSGETTPWESGAAFAQRRPLELGIGGEVYALRSETRKYVLRTEGDDEYYDLTVDPGEQTNLGADASSAARMRSELEARLTRYRIHGRAFPAAETLEGSAEELRALGYAR